MSATVCNLRRSPFVLACIYRVHCAFVRDIIDEHIDLPVFTHDAYSNVADHVGWIPELGIWFVSLRKRLKYVEAVARIRPLRADEEILRSQEARRLVVLDPRRRLCTRNERQPEPLDQVRSAIAVQVMCGVGLGLHLLVVDTEQPALIRRVVEFDIHARDVRLAQIRDNLLPGLPAHPGYRVVRVRARHL